MITESGLAKKVTRIQVRSSYLIWISCGSVSSSGFSLVLWLFLIECWKSQVKNQSENLRLWMKLLPPGRTGLFLLLAGRWTRDTDNPKSSSFNRYWNALNQDSRPFEGWLWIQITLDHPSLLSDGLSSLRCWPGSFQLGLFNLCPQPCESGKNSAQILSQTSTKTS